MTPTRPMADLLDDMRQLVSAELGLHFPRERTADLKRGLKAAARELGLDDIEAAVRWLCSASPVRRAEVLARHLTVGETYFFRHENLFAALEQHVLPELIRKKAARERRLRLWSAACCTGEETYSLAILLHRLLPHPASWDIGIVGTDLNTRFLDKAREGVFGAWSFRDTPPGFRERYFSPCADGSWKILPQLRSLVRFTHGNLADDADIDREARGADIILCRNALIYFTTKQAERLVARLADGLAPEGWLMTAPSETAMITVPSLQPVRFSGAIVFQKTPATTPSRTVNPPPVTTSGHAPVDAADFITTSAGLDPLHTTPASPPDDNPAPPPAVEPPAREEPLPLVRQIRALANQGLFADARAQCDLLIAREKFNPAAHYLRASVLQETGERDDAIAALKRALYLEPDFVLAHFALGNLLRAQGDPDAAHRHFANALELARRRPAEDVLPESDGLTAGQLVPILVALRDARLSA